MGDMTRREVVRWLAAGGGVALAAPAGAVLQEAVDAVQRDRAGGLSGPERWDRSRAVVGRFGSESADPVSDDHDRYLDDIQRS